MRASRRRPDRIAVRLERSTRRRRSALPSGRRTRGGVAHARPRAGVRRPVLDPAPLHRLRADARAARDRHGRGGAPNDLHCRITARRGRRGQTRGHGEAALPEPGRGGPDDRGVPAGATCKLMYAEELCFAPKYVRLKQLVDERRARRRPTLVKQSGEARRPPRRPLLGRRALRRRRHHGHGLPRRRVLPLDARQDRPPRHSPSTRR